MLVQNKSLTFLVLFAVLATSGLYAQIATGRIHGTTIDASQAVIPGASVIVTEVDTGVKRVLISNDVGAFNAPKLSIGNYKVEATLPGFKKYEQTGIIIRGGSVEEIDIVMQVGEIAEVVSVVSTGLKVNTTTGTQRTTLDVEVIELTPLNGRDANDLIRLVPGTVQIQGQGNDFGGNKYSVSGNRQSSNNFTLDGTDNNDWYNSASTQLPPPDALREFTVQSNYSAEHGRGGGAQVAAIIRSGTNQLHGSGYDYFRSENLNANSFQRNAEGVEEGEFKRHQLGYTVGGPIYFPLLYDGRDKTFFFISHQVLQTPANPYLHRRGGLTAAELGGDFSQSVIIPTLTQDAISAVNSPFAGMSVGDQVTDLSGMLSPTALDWYTNVFNHPIVENSGDRFFDDASQNLNLPEFTVKVDHTIKESNTLGFSLYWRHDAPDARLINDAPPNFRSVDQLKNMHFTLSDVHTFSPTVVNEFRAGYVFLDTFRNAKFGDLSFEALGFPYPQSDPSSFVEIKTLRPSFFNFRARNVKAETRDGLEFSDTFSITHGSHYIKVGGSLKTLGTKKTLSYHHEYSYSGSILDNRAAEWIIGWPASVGAYAEPIYRNAAKWVPAFFFQDDWKVNPRLTLNLGIRYEPELWAIQTNDRVLYFIPGARSEFSNFPDGLVKADEAASPYRAGRPNDLNNWAPRLGLAYRLDDEGTKVFRGGWGIFYDATNGVFEGEQLAAAFPFVHRWGTRFNRGFPGDQTGYGIGGVNPDGWLNMFTYNTDMTGGVVPDLSTPLDFTTATFSSTDNSGRLFLDGRQGFNHQWNFTFENEFRPGWIYSAGYVGNRGVDLWGRTYWNTPLPRDANDSNDQENTASRRPLQEYRYREKSPQLAHTRSEYHAAQFQLLARTDHLNVIAHYTLSRARAHIDSQFRNRTRSHPFDLERDWARPMYDRPHNLLIMPSYDLPFMRGRRDVVGSVLGGWNATFIFNIQSGQPVNFTAPNRTFQGGNLATRPNETGQAIINGNWRQDPDLIYVNPGSVEQPADGTFGNASRNAIRWTSPTNTDLTLTKRFYLHGEDVMFDLKFDFFNLFNHSNWAAPGGVNVSTANQGVDGDFSMKNRWTLPARTIQIGGRIAF